MVLGMVTKYTEVFFSWLSFPARWEPEQVLVTLGGSSAFAYMRCQEIRNKGAEERSIRWTFIYVPNLSRTAGCKRIKANFSRVYRWKVFSSQRISL